MLHKKGFLAWNKLIGWIILGAGFLLIVTLIFQNVLKAEEVITDDIARNSVKLTCGSKEMTKDIISTPPLHVTKHKEIPEQGNTKEAFNKDLADLVSSCWYQFNDGNTCDDLWEGFWTTAVGKTKEKCFICYTFDMKQLEDADIVTKTEFFYWMNNNLKFVEEETDYCKYQGGFCTEDEKAFLDSYGEDSKYFKCEERNDKCNQIDPEKNTCCYSFRYTCLNKGGRCEDKNFINIPENKDKYKKYSTWTCPGDKECFVDVHNYYTYLGYIQSYGEEGSLRFQTIENFEPHSDIYAVTFSNGVIPGGIIDKLIDELLTENAPYITISKLNKVKEYCSVQKDIKGR